MTTPAIPAPTRQWAGVGESTVGIRAAGRRRIRMAQLGNTQYVQMVNEGLQVFDKLTGTSLLGPIPIRAIWFGLWRHLPDPRGMGDPIVVYDRLADRWVISQFATSRQARTTSKTSVSLFLRPAMLPVRGTRYDFHLSIRMPDYPKFGVWPDGYYMSAIMFVPTRQWHLG